MSSVVRSGMLRARAAALRDAAIRLHVEFLLGELDRTIWLIRLAKRHGLDAEANRAGWCRDRLDSEISARIAKAEAV